MSAEAIAAVQAELEREEEFLVDLTQQLVRIPTVNPKFEAHVSLNHEADLQHYLRMMLDDFGMRTENYDVFPGRANLIGTLPGGEARSLILCGHVDVVPVGDRRKWSFDPFGGEISDRRLYGRGALDMKSGLAAGVAVARAIARAGVVLDGRLELHAVVDGEAGGSGARDLVERGRHAAGLILMEPTWQALMPAGSGYEWVRVTFRGRSAHAAWRYNEIFPQPDAPERLEPGVNALTIAARFVTAVQELERDWTTRKPAHPLLPPGANTIHPGVMVCGAGTTATGLPQLLTNPAIVPDVAVIDFHIMFLPNETSEQIREEFEAFVDAFAAQDFVAARASAAGAMGFARSARGAGEHADRPRSVPRRDRQPSRAETAHRHQGLRLRIQRRALCRRRHPDHHVRPRRRRGAWPGRVCRSGFAEGGDANAGVGGAALVRRAVAAKRRPAPARTRPHRTAADRRPARRRRPHAPAARTPPPAPPRCRRARCRPAW